MKNLKWYIKIIAIFVFLSTITYYLQIRIFDKADDTFFYMMQDFAFVPVNVLFVALILDRMLKRREKENLLNKLNMVIGVFFHKQGYDLMRIFAGCGDFCSSLALDLKADISWSDRIFDNKIKYFKKYKFDAEISIDYLKKIKELLMERRDFITNLLGNPNLLEHDAFTDLLWAVFHLTDELYHREDISYITDRDHEHLMGDIRRVFNLIIVQWLSYLKHLKNDYPYLYSIALRTNPFDSEAKIYIE